MLDTTQQDIATGADAIRSNLKATGSQALVLQGHANLIGQQATIDLSAFEKLAGYEERINGSIASAKQHANTYIQVILPKMIGTSTSIDRFFNLQNALGTALQPGTATATATKLIGTVQDQATLFRDDARDIADRLHVLNGDLNNDAGSFKAFVTDMNAAVNGDNGVLASIDSQIGDLDTQIAVASSAIALGGLAVLGGGLMIATGAIAEVITAGTSSMLVLAGVGVAAAGVASVTAGGITLSHALDAKGDLLSKKEALKGEVAYALSLKSNFTAITGSCLDGARAAGDMANAWDMMTGHMGNLIRDLESGRTSVDELRQLFLTAAQGDVRNILSDNAMIQRQLAGVSVVDTGDKPGSLTTTISDYMKLAA